MCLLGAVKAVRGGRAERPAPREAAVAAIQAHLWPKRCRAPRTGGAAEGLSEGGAGGRARRAQEPATAHPSVLSARSTSKGYGAMHFAAMAGRCPCSTGSPRFDAAAPSSPPDGSAAVARRGGGRVQARRCGAAPPPPRRRPRLPRGAAGDDEARLAAAARAGHGAAAVLLARDPSLARRPAVAGRAARSRWRRRAAERAARAARRGAVAADGGAAASRRRSAAATPTPPTCSTTTNMAVTLTLGDATALPAAAPADAPPPLLSALVLDAKLSAHRSLIVGAADPVRDARRAAWPRGRVAPLD